MNRCTECNFPLEEGLLSCPQCGAELAIDGRADGTVNVSPDLTDQTVDYEGPLPLDAELDDEQAEPSGEAQAIQSGHHSADTQPPGSGTVNAPGIDADMRNETVDYADDEADEENAANQTVDAGLTELDEADDFDFDDEFPGVLSDSFESTPADRPLNTDTTKTLATNTGEKLGTAEEASDGYGTVDANGESFAPELSEFLDQQRTINAFGIADDSQTVVDSNDPNATQVFETHESEADAPGNLTVEMGSEDNLSPPDDTGRTTVIASGDGSIPSGQTPAAAPDSDDSAGTVVLPSNDRRDSIGEKTVVYESTDSGNSTVQASGTSGTEGRLKRLWEGVAGSSENPMHSLQAVGLQASDSVFQRVATRRVADASVAQDISADYQIVDKLGEGAMGIVFSARQTAVNRIVAIKTAKPNFQANDDSRRRFLYEAHITADLDHSNIVPIHELGASEEGMLFYSMKLVQGTEWSRVMRKKTREQNLEIFMKVTDAMAFAHSKGVIHRDLKPENTMLGRFGEVFVTDWGTAINLDKDTTYLAQPAAKGDKFLTVEDSSNLVRGDSIVLHDGVEAYDRVQIVSIDESNRKRLYLRRKLTRDYQPSRRLRVVKAMNLAGTPCYMAPEMAGHQLPKIGRTSDIYILGAILYDLVMGRPPHTGDSVTQCLRAALKNNAIATDNDDPLMKIAYKAMSTEPSNRYQTVEELQEAVREYRRHAESIALTERSDELLDEAIAKKDYDSFSRTLFGYRDAIDLWPQNTGAISGLKRARLAFGQTAFEQGNYDLALQTLDRQEDAESALADRALAAKKKVEGREASLRLLQKVIAAVILLAVVGLSALSWIANDQKNRAIAAQGIAETERQNAVSAAAQEKQAKEQETQAKLAAQAAEETAIMAKRDEETQRLKAEESAREALRQGELAQKSAVLARQEQARAEEEERRAETAAELAQRRSAQIQLGEYNASLALAKSQIESFDLAAGSDNLQRLREMFGVGNAEQEDSTNVFFGNTPKIDSWGWKRIELLGNFDLPKAHIGSPAGDNPTDVASPSANLIPVDVRVSACAPAANLAVVGTQQGLVQVLKFSEGELRATAKIIEAGATIDAVAVSPNGQEIVYSCTRAGESSVKRWDVAQSVAQPVAATQKRGFQYFAYSTDGKQLVAGISGGIWLWDHNADWYQQAEPKYRVSIRGDLTNLQSIDPNHTLLTTRFQDKLTLIGMLDHSSQSIQLLEADQELSAPIRSAAHTLVDNRIVLGLANNRLLIGNLIAGETKITNLVELPDKHRAPVTHIASNGVNRLVTSSESEPVAHVWRLPAESANWEYETYLTGTPKNIVGVGLLGTEQVLAVDAGGTSIVWNVERQKQRRQLQRTSAGEPAEYIAPVQAVVAGSSSGRALAIDQNGVIDLWSLADGTTERVDGSRWSYIGHTPGAVLVNSAVDVENGMVVTAASLKDAHKEYLDDPTHQWEFCSWDATSGAMLRRWSAANRQVSDNRTESIEQRVSLVDKGRQILFASDSETRLVELSSGMTTFERSDFGSYFAVPNPRNASQLMLVKRSGAVRLLDVADATSWNNPAMRNFSLADPSDIPLKGMWSNDGRRFYLTFSTGGLAVFEWSGSQLDLNWSTRKLEGSGDIDELRQALLADRSRVQSHLDIDLAVTTNGGNDIVTIATRQRGLDATTKMVALRFNDQAAQPALIRASKEQGVQWLQGNTSENPGLASRIHDRLLIDDSRIRSRLKVNNLTFVSTTAAQVLALTDGSPEVTSFGRMRLQSASGNQQGTELWTLLEDGAIWKFTVESNSGKWSRMPYSALGASQISLSPDSQQLLVVNQGEGTLVDPNTGKLISNVGAVRGVAWDPQSPARLAVCRTDGTLEVISQGMTDQLAERPILAADARLVQLSFFFETWEDPARPARQFLLVHSEQRDKGALQFVAIDPTPPGASQNAAEIEEIPLDSRVAVSPTENVLVTGAPGGTVTVWFAAPTHDPKPQPLFDLEGHRGEQLTCITFSNDGRTVITADTKNRLFAWLSSDPLIKPAQ